jgi:hypothetical protein
LDQNPVKGPELTIKQGLYCTVDVGLKTPPSPSQVSGAGNLVLHPCRRPTRLCKRQLSGRIQMNPSRCSSHRFNPPLIRFQGPHPVLGAGPFVAEIHLTEWPSLPHYGGNFNPGAPSRASPTTACCLGARVSIISKPRPDSSPVNCHHRNHK